MKKFETVLHWAFLKQKNSRYTGSDIYRYIDINIDDIDIDIDIDR